MNNDNQAPDYSQYTIEELEDVVASVNQAQYPERYTAALAMLEEKKQQRGNVEGEHEEAFLEPEEKPKWSEQLLITQILMGTFFAMVGLTVPAMFYEFMTAKWWADSTSGLIWFIGLAMTVMWFVCLAKDPKLHQRLGHNYKGKLSIGLMPFIFFMMTWISISRGLPIGLHLISAQTDVQEYMDFRKRGGKKHCRNRLEIMETDELQDGNLCMTGTQREHFPERGKVMVLGSRSDYGLMLEGFALP